MKKEIIELVFCPEDSKEAEKLAERGNIAEILFHYKTKGNTRYTKMIFREDKFRREDLYHEIGHYLQELLVEEGFEFKHEHEIPFLLEDVMNNFLRKKLYNLNDL